MVNTGNSKEMILDEVCNKKELNQTTNKGITKNGENLSKRLQNIGRGPIPLINEMERCYCEKSCNQDCLNRIRHIECNRYNCGLSGRLYDVYCNNRPFFRYNSKKKKKFIVSKFRTKSTINLSKRSNLNYLNVDFSTTLTKLSLTESASAGELIIECLGEIINNLDVRERYLSYFQLKDNQKGNIKNENTLYTIATPERLFGIVENFLYLDMTQNGNEARHIRHSCNPNCQAQVWIVRPTGRSIRSSKDDNFAYSWLHIGIFALSNIPKDTEITIDYENILIRAIPSTYLNSSINNTGYINQFICNCGFSECRGIIGKKIIPNDDPMNPYLLPIKSQKKKRINSHNESDQDDIINEINSYENKKSKTDHNSLSSFINLKKSLMENQRKYKYEEYNSHNNNNSKSYQLKFSTNTYEIFEEDKSLIINKSKIENEYVNNDISKNIYPLWHIFSSICISGPYYRNFNCCNNSLLHSQWWNKLIDFSKNTNSSNREEYNNHNQIRKPIERLRRSGAATRYYDIAYNLSIIPESSKIKKSKLSIFMPFVSPNRNLFFHVMTHPWLLFLCNLTTLECKLVQKYKIFHIKSVDFGRWYLVQRLTKFFHLFNVTDEDLIWPLIDQGIGNDEKCFVCCNHGILMSCDKCYKGIHKLCSKRCNQFIQSSEFQIPEWLNNIQDENFFNNLIYKNIQDNKKLTDTNNLHQNKNFIVYKPLCKNNISSCINSNPEYNINSTSLKKVYLKPSNNLDNHGVDQFVCYRCELSSHLSFWNKINSKERRKITNKVMANKLKLLFYSNLLSKDSLKSKHSKPKLVKKQIVSSSNNNNILLRSARLLLSNMMNWRLKNSIQKNNLNITQIYCNLSKIYIQPKKIDQRWDSIDNNPTPNFIKSSNIIQYSDSESEILILSHFIHKIESINHNQKYTPLEISVQSNCHITNSISLDDFVKKIKSKNKVY